MELWNYVNQKSAEFTIRKSSTNDDNYHVLVWKTYLRTINFLNLFSRVESKLCPSLKHKMAMFNLPKLVSFRCRLLLDRLNLGWGFRPSCQCLKLPSDDIFNVWAKGNRSADRWCSNLSQNFDNRQIAVVLFRRGIWTQATSVIINIYSMSNYKSRLPKLNLPNKFSL